MSGLAIVIVTWNSEAEIGECVAAARRTGHETVVVDNASSDDSAGAAERAGARVIRSSRNLGFAGAVNLAVRSTESKLLLLLNPDAILQTGLDAMIAVCNRPGVGAAGGKLVGTDGRPQIGFAVRRFPTAGVLSLEALLINRLWPRNPVNWQYRCYDFDSETAAEVDQPAGAFLMFRRDLWERLGGFDESFWPVWFEEVDFLKRTREFGLQIHYVPACVAVHSGGHSVAKISLEHRPVYWYGNVLRYGAKHFSPWAQRGLCLAIMCGALVRMISGMFLLRRGQPVLACSKIWSLAFVRLLSIRAETQTLLV